MDVVADVLRLVRLRGSVFFRAPLTEPWGFDLDPVEEPRFHAILAGRAMVQTARMARPVQLECGDVFLLPMGDAHWIGSSPESKRIPSAVAGEAEDHGSPYFRGDAVDCQLVCGIFMFDGDFRQPMIDLLPNYIHLMAGQDQPLGVHTIARLIDQEKRVGGPGSEVMIDRLCEVLMIKALHLYIQQAPNPQGLLAAIRDRRLAGALEKMHNEPEQAWTLEKLARAAGLSRAAFAENFKKTVGIPAIEYLAGLRMTKAKELLLTTSINVSEVAYAVGYHSEDGFRRAFQRRYGFSPEQGRTRG